jgi:Response regulator containing CheY-like receiver domain and AraC-type DNA-binding domain
MKVLGEFAPGRYRMYRLLIVDDEQIVLDSVRFIAQKDVGDVLSTEVAGSGREAIERAEAFRPDIVIMDIRMPGLSGLDAIAAIKKIQNGALFIIITAYEKFEFARDAINLGVFDYITKPLSRSAVSAALKKAIAVIDAERKKLNMELEFREKMAYILPALESGFVYSMLFSDDHANELEDSLKIMGIRTDGGYAMTIEFGEEDGKNRLSNKIGSGIRSQRFYPALRDAVKGCCDGIVGPVMLNRVIVYVPCGDKAGEYEQRVEALNIASSICNKLKSLSSIAFYIGIGGRYSSVQNIYKSFEESVKAIGYACGNACGPSVVHINDIPLEQRMSRIYPASEEKQLFRYLTAGDTKACLLSFKRIYEWVTDEYGGDTRKAVSSLTELMIMLGRTHGDYCQDGKDNLNGTGYINEFLAIEDAGALQSFMQERIKLICSDINRVRETKLSAIVEAARSYIHENYSRDITLKAVSKEVNVSPNYFSKIFKDETGSNFIDYLTDLRIEKAKEMLCDSNCYNKEICFQIGYSDPNYFSRIFKRIVGVTPTEYKASLTGRPD